MLHVPATQNVVKPSPLHLSNPISVQKVVDNRRINLQEFRELTFTDWLGKRTTEEWGIIAATGGLLLLAMPIVYALEKRANTNKHNNISTNAPQLYNACSVGLYQQLETMRNSASNNGTIPNDRLITVDINVGGYQLTATQKYQYGKTSVSISFDGGTPVVQDNFSFQELSKVLVTGIEALAEGTHRIVLQHDRLKGHKKGDVVDLNFSSPVYVFKNVQLGDMPTSAPCIVMNKSDFENVERTIHPGAFGSDYSDLGNGLVVVWKHPADLSYIEGYNNPYSVPVGTYPLIDDDSGNYNPALGKCKGTKWRTDMKLEKSVISVHHFEVQHETGKKTNLAGISTGNFFRNFYLPTTKERQKTATMIESLGKLGINAFLCNSSQHAVIFLDYKGRPLTPSLLATLLDGEEGLAIFKAISAAANNPEEMELWRQFYIDVYSDSQDTLGSDSDSVIDLGLNDVDRPEPDNTRTQTTSSTSLIENDNVDLVVEHVLLSDIYNESNRTLTQRHTNPVHNTAKQQNSLPPAEEKFDPDLVFSDAVQLFSELKITKVQSSNINHINSLYPKLFGIARELELAGEISKAQAVYGELIAINAPNKDAAQFRLDYIEGLY